MASKPRKRPAQRVPQTEQADIESVPAGAAPQPTVRAGDGRPKCNAPDCVLPEFLDGIGVCGGHYATHRGYANKSRS